MPKTTFLNLPAKKRARFLALAVREFADNDYAGASISRLVAQAGIAKGSLYQYFADKQDLFLYLIEHAQGVLLGDVATAGTGSTGPTGGILDPLRLQMSATVSAALRHPQEARLIQRAYQSPAAIRRKLERHDARVRHDHMRALVVAAQTTGELAPDLDPEVTAHVLAAIVGGLGPLVLTRLGLDPERDTSVPADRLDPAVLEPIFDSVLRIVREGVATRPGRGASRRGTSRRGTAQRGTE